MADLRCFIRLLTNRLMFLFKDVISLGVSFYLISYFGNKAILCENDEGYLD